MTPSYCDPTICSRAASPTAVSDISVVVEADALNAFEVKLPPQVYSSLLSHCSTCFGYTLHGFKCKNFRRPLGCSSNLPVWCHRHHSQEKEFKRYLVTGTRPMQCLWWEKYLVEELVMHGRKLSI